MAGRTKTFEESNKYKVINEEDSEFYIVNRKSEEFTVKISTDDLYRLLKYNKSWNASWRKDSQSYYVCACEYLETVNGKPKYKIHYLHRWLFDYPEGIVIDHINHDTLDNRRTNLRLTEQKKNLEHRSGANKNNKSGYRNVCLIENKWIVQLQINGKNTKLGSFDDVHEAGKFAEEMRQKYYGEFKGKG